jgi:hypothetical protein
MFQPAAVERRGDAGPGRRLLGDHQDAGVARGDEPVQPMNEVDRLEVLAPAVAVRNPLAGFAAVVAVEHRGDRIDAQAIDVEGLDPVERARQQEAGDLAAA